MTFLNFDDATRRFFHDLVDYPFYLFLYDFVINFILVYETNYLKNIILSKYKF